jgi:hypothetical protein
MTLDHRIMDLATRQQLSHRMTNDFACAQGALRWTGR